MRRSEVRAKAPGAAWKDPATLAHWGPDLGAALSVARRIQRVSPYPREADKDT